MDYSSEATPLMLTIVEGEKSQDDDEQQQHYASTSFESDGEPPTFTRVHRKWQQSASGRKHHRKGSSFFSFASGILNFTNSINKKKQQHHGQQHQHRRSPTTSVFDFGSTIMRELSHDFADYEELESIALNALFSIAQPILTGEDDGEEQVVFHHPTLLDPEELIAATALIVEEELDYGDLKWSLLSNTFFIFGGFYETLNAIWDIVDINGQFDNNPSRKIWSILRITVVLLGPIVYCLNSIVDITWAMRVEQRQDRRQQLDELQIDLIAPDKDVEVVERQDSKGEMKSVRLRLPFEPHNVWRRLRRHIGHRRALSAAVAFGVGAILEFVTSYLGEFSSTISEEGLHVFDALSVNAYVASAVFALTEKGDKRKLKPWTEMWNDAPRLESLGDILFGVAMTVDFSICYLHLNEWGSVGFLWPLISALLWQFDALCYLRADVNSMTLYKASRPLGDTVASSETSSTSSVS